MQQNDRTLVTAVCYKYSMASGLEQEVSEESAYHDLVAPQEEEAVHQNFLVPQLLDGALLSAPNAVA